MVEHMEWGVGSWAEESYKKGWGDREKKEVDAGKWVILSFRGILY